MHLPNLVNIKDSSSSSNKAFKRNPSGNPPSYNESISQVSSPISLTPVSSASRVPTLSSSSTRSKTSGNIKNVPYKPSAEQQRQINLLGGGRSPIAELSTVSSHSQTEYFDVLPSFQMFQSILKRDDRQFQEDLSSLPPGYGDVTNSSPTPPTLSPSNSRDRTIDEAIERLNEYGLAQERDEMNNDEYLFEEHDHNNHNNNNNNNTLSPVGSTVNANVHNQNIEVTHDTYGHSPLDNIDKLHKLPHSPIDIQIYVTKQIPQPNANNDLETRLKEYTSGDFVNGYITVINKSHEPVEFGLFTVSLEGTIKSVERNPHATTTTSGLTNKFSKILMKKFLKMYDLNASYGYVQVPNSAGIEYEPFSHDLSDGSVIGLPTDRLLQPNIKYKKFFTFKFPHRLLDNACINSLLPHLLPPPSMGIDRTCFYNRGEGIQLNKALGYGFLNVRGTPMLTKDYSFDDLSISYTIEAKFIDRLNSTEPISHDEINNNNATAAEYVISKNAQYFLRFIPDLKEQVQYCKRFQIGGYPVNGIGGKFMQQYLNKLTWKDIKLQNFEVEKEIDEKLLHMELSPEEVKNKNLIINVNNENTTTNNNKNDNSLRQEFKPPSCEIENNIIITKIPTEIFGKKKKMILSSLVKIGESKLSVIIPDKIIPYASPRLLMKYNNSKQQPQDEEEEELDSLRPVLSHMDEIYNRNKEDIIDSIKLKLEFITTDNNIRAPEIQSVDVNIIFWSYSTDYPIPFELGYDFFYTNENNQDEYIKDPVEITRSNLQNLKDQVSNYISFVKENKISLSRDTFLYLKSIKSLGVKKDTIKDYFQIITDSNLLNHEGSWKVEQLNNNSKGFRYCKDLTIPLTILNKNNVNLLPSFQSCLVGRLYCLQVMVRYKGTNNDQNEFADNIVKVDVPILVG
ncbi:ubiquitin ligase-binding protein, putatuve [Candida dubliniensis CD36]|uniref:Ubiquitin ligase-binding protein, putatuve n=1 Tax=Candida dubliniensis (strain CD36 / ATCC MYA-646 / CBS 7987 / NCPF 3949 / NRRL Y-17841) TaxID=573826 RepID=B9WFL6_CANDC|nr:ubiquitin ligase-binding protein, putatuve [Candida dubliniensis CD36]CAX42035.1 ubiquitin ligase-binding protein, putatuve [Candida dubliniensis CD36]